MTGDQCNPQPFSFDKRKAALGIVFALLLAGGAFTAIGQLADFHRLQQAFTHANKLWLPVCVLGQLLAYFGYMLRGTAPQSVRSVKARDAVKTRMAMPARIRARRRSFAG